MDKLYNSLIILNYEKKFCKKYGLNSIDSKYFLQNSNTGDQVFMFVSLASWIIKHLNQSYKISMPKESDDLNLIISNILKFLPKDRIASYSISKLKSGYGEQVISLLNVLIDMWLSNQNFEWHQLILNNNQDSEKDYIIDQEANYNSFSSTSSNCSEYEEANDAKINENSVVNANSNNIVERNEEFESVLPDLKNMVLNDLNGLQNITQLQNLYKNITDTFGDIEYSINSLLNKHSNSMDNLKEKEKKLNILVATNFGEVKDAYQKYKTILANHEVEDKALKDKQQTLEKLTFEVNNIRTEIKKRVDGMTDTSELQKSTLLLTQLQEEIFDMDIKINFLSTLMEH